LEDKNLQPEQDKIIQLLLRHQKSETGEERQLESFLDRLLMRIYSSASLTVYMHDAKVVGTTIELTFNEIPAEIVPKIIALIGVPGVEPVSYRGENHHLFTGFRFTPDKRYLEEL
jgi:hypothetical protein